MPRQHMTDRVRGGRPSERPPKESPPTLNELHELRTEIRNLFAPVSEEITDGIRYSPSETDEQYRDRVDNLRLIDIDELERKLQGQLSESKNKANQDTLRFILQRIDRLHALRQYIECYAMLRYLNKEGGTVRNLETVDQIKHRMNRLKEAIHGYGKGVRVAITKLSEDLDSDVDEKIRAAGHVGGLSYAKEKDKRGAMSLSKFGEHLRGGELSMPDKDTDTADAVEQPVVEVQQVSAAELTFEDRLADFRQGLIELSELSNEIKKIKDKDTRKQIVIDVATALAQVGNVHGARELIEAETKRGGSIGNDNLAHGTAYLAVVRKLHDAGSEEAAKEIFPRQRGAIRAYAQAAEGTDAFTDYIVLAIEVFADEYPWDPFLRIPVRDTRHVLHIIEGVFRNIHEAPNQPELNEEILEAVMDALIQKKLFSKAEQVCDQIENMRKKDGKDEDGDEDEKIRGLNEHLTVAQAISGDYDKMLWLIQEGRIDSLIIEIRTLTQQGDYGKERALRSVLIAIEQLFLLGRDRADEQYTDKKMLQLAILLEELGENMLTGHEDLWRVLRQIEMEGAAGTVKDVAAYRRSSAIKYVRQGTLATTAAVLESIKDPQMRLDATLDCVDVLSTPDRIDRHRQDIETLLKTAKQVLIHEAGVSKVDRLHEKVDYMICTTKKTVDMAKRIAKYNARLSIKTKIIETANNVLLLTFDDTDIWYELTKDDVAELKIEEAKAYVQQGRQEEVQKMIREVEEHNPELTLVQRTQQAVHLDMTKIDFPKAKQERIVNLKLNIAQARIEKSNLTWQDIAAQAQESGRQALDQ